MYICRNKKIRNASKKSVLCADFPVVFFLQYTQICAGRQAIAYRNKHRAQRREASKKRVKELPATTAKLAFLGLVQNQSGIIQHIRSGHKQMDQS